MTPVLACRIWAIWLKIGDLTHKTTMLKIYSLLAYYCIVIIHIFFFRFVIALSQKGHRQGHAQTSGDIGFWIFLSIVNAYV